MISIPKALQTREDYDRVYDKAKSAELERPAIIQHFLGLIESAYHFEFDKNLEESEEPDGALPDYFVAEESEDTPRHQLRRVINNSAKIFKLGYTLEEVEIIIQDLENL